MAENTQDCKISLLSREISSFTDLIVKIPNIFALPEYNDGNSFNLQSPTFEFANASWCFEFQSRDREIKLEEGIVSVYVYMVKLNFTIQQQQISYTVVLLNDDNETYDSMSESEFFDESNYRIIMWTPHVEKASFVKRDTLTFIIHLFDVKSAPTEVNAEQVSITMNKGLNLLSKGIESLLTNEEFCDVTLRVKNKEFKAHKIILAARSPVFASYFKYETPEEHDGIIDIPHEIIGCDADSFKQFLEYLYSGKLQNISFRRAFYLYKISHKYEVGELKMLCADQMLRNLDVNHFFIVVTLADAYGDETLFVAARNYFTRNLGEIFSAAGWKNLMKNNQSLVHRLLMEMSSCVEVVAKRRKLE